MDRLKDCLKRGRSDDERRRLLCLLLQGAGGSVPVPANGIIDKNSLLITDQNGKIITGQ